MTAAWIDAGALAPMPSIESVLLAHANASHHNRLSQRPSQGDEGYEDDCDDSDEAKGTVNVGHDGQYLHLPVESGKEHRPRSRRSGREDSR
jgi:hypothetical protein